MNVYCITFPNGKRYAGVEGKTGTRKSAHSRSKSTNSDTFVSRAIRKYKWENCKFEYLVINKSSKYCYALEIELIAKWKLQDPEFGYNQSSGGERGFSGVKMSQAHKDKIGKANRGKKVSRQTRLKLSRINKGKKISESHRLAIVKSLIGNPGRNKGKKHSSKTKRKISKALMGENNPFFGKTHSLETIAKIIASNKRRAKNVTRKNP